MLLGEILHRDSINIAMESTEKFNAIDELLDVLIHAGDLSIAQRDYVRVAIVDREKSMSTGMEMGLAIPHGSSRSIQSLVGAMGISETGIDFGCLDGKPAHLIILLVLPYKEMQIRVRTLGGISHLLNDVRFCQSLTSAPDADTILELIKKEERKSVFDGFR